MQETDKSTYYALVWNTTLSSNKKQIIQGEKVTRSTRLPKDPRMLYGTNNQDVAKIIKKDNWTEIQYDIMTQKQSIKFWTEIDEYVISRDIRIIVWQGEQELSLPSKQYKIVAPDLFEHICRTCCEDEIDNIEWSKNIINEIVNIIDIQTTEGLHFNYDQVKVTPDTIIYRKRIDDNENRFFK